MSEADRWYESLRVVTSLAETLSVALLIDVVDLVTESATDAESLTARVCALGLAIVSLAVRLSVVERALEFCWVRESCADTESAAALSLPMLGVLSASDDVSESVAVLRRVRLLAVESLTDALS